MSNKLKATGLVGLVLLLFVGVGASGGSHDDAKNQSSQVSSHVEKKASSQATSHAASSQTSSKKKAATSVRSSSASSKAVAASSSAAATGNPETQVQGLNGTVQKPLPYASQRQMVMASLDHLGRARDSHIQLSNAEEPTAKRSERLTYDPVGWHNFKFWYSESGEQTGSKQAWLMARGHLVGYQFSGLNDEARNLVPETAWMNSGNYSGMDEGNTASMLYYENHLDSWLATHPNFRLDYQVTPLYAQDELIPRKVRLAYVGYDDAGKRIQIKVGGGREESGDDDATVVYLDNTSPNAIINYADGTATNTVSAAPAAPVASAPAASSSAPVASSESSVAPAAQAPATTNDPTVYVTGGGSSAVYWYGTDSMPANTNKANLVQMPESQAIQQGKRHSMTER
ncbi:DNA/RNA non-specific endonuclease [uncultured Weissella sp.]|uniref:DNA/RNA non-specific endonuclease n=1 Tax=uncultured Weissella sp. TaxID=253243 RepID=UPI002592177C|nr:DNA/RNA non-specific endonuclease [uncultured Weissella sp.]